MVFEIDTSVFGLILIAIAWILQLIYSWNGEREIRKRTLIMYNFGIAVLIIDSLVYNPINSTALVNLIILILTSIVLIKISKHELKKEKKIKKKK